MQNCCEKLWTQIYVDHLKRNSEVVVFSSKRNMHEKLPLKPKTTCVKLFYMQFILFIMSCDILKQNKTKKLIWIAMHPLQYN